MSVVTAEPDTSSVSERVEMLDLARWHSNRRAKGFSMDRAAVTLTWDDGRYSRFSAIWLRDNCPCPACRHPQALERRFLLVESSDEIAIAAGRLTPGGNLEVRFAPEPGGSDGHVSRFDAGWLRHHCSFADDPASPQHPIRLWDASIASALPTVFYEEVMTSDAGLAAWLSAMLENGLVLLRAAPGRPGELLRIAQRVQTPRATNFGTVFDVMTVPNPNASADTPMGLEPHTDNANWERPPDFQLLFCVANAAEGGESTLVDGFRVAEELRQADPAAFRLLSTYPVGFRFQDETCDIRYAGPTIETDPGGRVVGIRFNNWLRTPFVLPEDVIEPMYRALRQFWQLLRDPRFQLRLKLNGGEMIGFDNRRVLHGRLPFNPNSGLRHIQGCSLDRDMVLSRLRVLERGPSQPEAARQIGM